MFPVLLGQMAHSDLILLALLGPLRAISLESRGAFLVRASFVLSFGLVKGTLNLVAGGLADRFGRKPVLLAGWLAAIPIRC